MSQTISDMPDRHELDDAFWRVADAFQQINDVFASIASVMSSMARYVESVMPAVRRASRHIALAKHRRHQDKRRCQAKAGRRERTGWRQTI